MTKTDTTPGEGPPQPQPLPAGDDPAAYPQEVQVVERQGRRFVLVGTAHVSKTSVELVRRVIHQERPDCVAVELDPQRYEALAHQRKWESLDLKQVIRQRQLTTLLVNLLLSAYQRRLGMELGIEPGTELLEAVRVAEELSIPVELCDRDVRITLRRAARMTPFWKKMILFSELLVALFEKPEISEEQIQELRQQDVLNEMMAELGRQVPEIKQVLIDERDTYLSQRILDSPGETVVAVVGAGHLQGIQEALQSDERSDLKALRQVPPPSPIWKILAWGIPLAILGAIGWIGWTRGAAEMGANLVFWILANGIPASIGALIALGHPMTILAAFAGAPFTSLTPVIGAGYVCAFVQAYFRPPKIKELKTVADDVGKPRRWWGNRLLRILLCFLLPTLGSFVGTWIGGVEIFSNLF